MTPMYSTVFAFCGAVPGVSAVVAVGSVSTSEDELYRAVLLF